jgi:hypothetical protein
MVWINIDPDKGKPMVTSGRKASGLGDKEAGLSKEPRFR